MYSQQLEALIQVLSEISINVKDPEWNDIITSDGKRGSLMIGISQALFQIADSLDNIANIMEEDRNNG